MRTTRLLVPRRSIAQSALFFRDLDRLFEALRDDGAATSRRSTLVPRIDLTETETDLRVSAELPGVDEKDMEVSLEDGILTIRGRRAQDESDAEGVRHRETRRGHFERQLRLPREVDPVAVTARHRNGILTVTLPKAAWTREREIPVTSA